jgi:hypothetical protein
MIVFLAILLGIAIALVTLAIIDPEEVPYDARIDVVRHRRTRGAHRLLAH